MNTTQRAGLLQRWFVIQEELIGVVPWLIFFGAGQAWVRPEQPAQRAWLRGWASATAISRLSSALVGFIPIVTDANIDY